MREIILNREWKLRNSDSSIHVPMKIPADVISTLHDHQLIANPFYAQNETELQWIGTNQWIMSTEFNIDQEMFESSTLLLELNEVDTIAEIFINGQLAGSCENMFASYTFEVKPLVHQGVNQIEILLYSAEQEASDIANTLSYPVPHMVYPVQSMHRNLIRKTQCHAGWDWGPCLMTSGVYEPPVIRASTTPIIEYVHCNISRDHDKWFVEVVCELFVPQPQSSSLTIAVAATVFQSDETLHEGHQEIRKILTVTDINLWWPAGYGDQNLYDLMVTLDHHTVTRQIGFRTIEVNTEPDQDGIPMTFKVNGTPIFCKGANWIPLDALPGRMDQENYIKLLSDAKEAHMNMIRVWGGGQYEREIFYETCDRLGLLVWQDFMFACSLYPAEPWFLQNVEKEVTHQVKRLKDHPCIAIWCGNNEDIGALTWFEESQENRDRYIIDYDRLNEGVIGRIVTRLDPHRQWWPSSPSAGPGDYSDCWHNDRKGDMHYWSVWHEGRGFEAYREVTPRFCSEFGFQSFPSLREIKTYTPQDQLNITSPVMESHQRNDRGNTIIISTISRYFRFPSSFEHIIYLSQVQQAMAIATAVTFWRSRRPVCMGTLYWQLNDTWPGASWSSIEYGGAWKLLHYAAKRFYAPSILSLIPTPDGNQLEVYGINDTPHPVSGRLQIERISFSGQRNTIYSSEAFAAESSSTLLTRIDMADVGVSRTEELLKVSLLDMESVHLLAAPKSCMLQKAHITVKKGGQSSLVLETDKPALFVQIGISGWDGRFSDNGFHLLPGTGKEISCREGELPENWHDRLSITSVRDTY